jgi:hypothetical protein
MFDPSTMKLITISALAFGFVTLAVLANTGGSLEVSVGGASGKVEVNARKRGSGPSSVISQP